VTLMAPLEHANTVATQGAKSILGGDSLVAAAPGERAPRGLTRGRGPLSTVGAACARAAGGPLVGRLARA
jgi:hypothetical protein